jgi:hypothetical protein
VDVISCESLTKRFGPQPGELAGLLGIVLSGAVAAVIARWRFSADVTV